MRTLHVESLLRAATAAAVCAALGAAGCNDPPDRSTGPEPSPEARAALGTSSQGRQIFRFYTFGDEPFWTDTLRLHEVVETAVDPATALAVGLKVDMERLPPGFLATADLHSPATTVELLRRDAVLGLRASVSGGRVRRLGVTCALCHSTVDDAAAPGIGRRLDGWPNRDLNVGAIVALSPTLSPEVKAVLASWGPGKYDAMFNQDGINDPVLIPPAYGLRDVALETYTGEGPVSYWNAYVAVTQMHGQGSFSDPRIGVDVHATPDRVTPVLRALREYQLGLEAPAPPAGSFDPALAEQGRLLFEGKGTCAGCHVAPTFTDVNLGVFHLPAETGMDPVRATRGIGRGAYRTTPLRGAWHRDRFFHDGSAGSLAEVVDHYDSSLTLGLSDEEKAALVEYLRSL